jgi:hypothetical protein
VLGPSSTQEQPSAGGSIPNRGLSIGGAKGTYDGQPYITGLRIAVALGQQSSPPCASRHNPVSIDGVRRSHRDRREIAVEAAGLLMAKYPHSAVAVKDLQSGERVAADYKLDLGRR